MDRSYEFAFIDGSIILRRNMSTMQWAYSQKDGYKFIVKSIIQSIFKIAREKVKAERYFILWDKSPYHKSEILKTVSRRESTYKKDRAKLNEDFLRTMGETKLALMKYAGSIGLTSIQFPGWEADDLAYLASQQVLGRSKKSILISFDSDWYFWIDRNTDYLNLKQNTIYTLSRVISMKPLVKGCDLFGSKAIRDSLRGSHNNLKNILKPEFQEIKCRDVLAMIESDDYSFTNDPDLFKAQYATFDFTTYPDYNKASTFLTYYMTSGRIGDAEDFIKFLKSVGLSKDSIDVSQYKKFISRLNPELWT